MSDLVKFLRARLDEDEQVALAATSGPWEWVGDIEAREATLCRTSSQLDVSVDVIYAHGEHTIGYIVVKPTDATHIERWDPARVLAEVEAKRRILAMHAPTQTDWPLLRVIALPYAAHPDYRDEWAPARS